MVEYRPNPYLDNVRDKHGENHEGKGHGPPTNLNIRASSNKSLQNEIKTDSVYDDRGDKECAA